MKKIAVLGIFLIFVVLFSVSAFAEQSDFTLEMVGAEKVACGEELSLTLYVRDTVDAMGIISTDFCLIYDPISLEFVDCSVNGFPGSEWKCDVKNKSEYGSLSFFVYDDSGNTPAHSEDIVFTILFRVKEQASLGNSSIELIDIFGSDSAFRLITGKCEPYSFVITSSFEDTPWNNPFNDIAKNAWYYNYIEFVCKNELFYGMSDMEFGPDIPMTRAMFVTVLGRFAKIDPSLYSGSDYLDVQAGSWYAPYVKWATEQGIVLGYGDGIFGTNESITREQMCTMIVRYSEKYGIGLKDGNGVSLFADHENISSYALESIYRCASSGIISGRENRIFDPKGLAKRCEIATVLFGLYHFE